MTSQHRGYFTLSAHQRPMVGDIKMGVTPFDHLGWMKCDGRTLSVSQYYQLWSVIGYSFTADGTPSTLFQLPNAGGTVPGIVGTGTDARNSTLTFALGQQYGEYQHQLTIPEMPSHNHDYIDPLHRHAIPDPGHAHSITDPTHTHSYSATNTNNQNVGYPAGGGSPDVNSGAFSATTSSNATGISVNTNSTGIVSTAFMSTGITILNRGGDVPHNNIQPTLTIGNMFVFSGYGRNAAGVTDPRLWPYAVSTNLL